MKPNAQISKYLTYAESIKSQTAERHSIPNIPDENQLTAMRFVAKNVFDPCREYVGGPLFASSFFRCNELNSLIGGSPTSQHPKGEAIDIDCDMFHNGTNKQVFDFIRKTLAFDQLIWEYGDDNNPAWVHVSLVMPPKKNRRQVLRIYSENGKQVAVPFDLYKI